MAGNTDFAAIQAAWVAFVLSVRDLLNSHPDDRPLDQYLKFRDDVLALVQGSEFSTAMVNAWLSSTPALAGQVGDLLLAELQAFPRAVEVARAQERESGGIAAWIPKWLGRASTVSGSVKDLLDGAPPLVKGGLTIFRELLDLFKGN
jgi:hypothetical protein